MFYGDCACRFCLPQWRRFTPDDKKLLLAYKNAFEMHHRAQPENARFASSDEDDQQWLNFIQEDRWE
jgi:hypothetical protein